MSDRQIVTASGQKAGLAQQAKNLGRAVADHVRTGAKTTTGELQRQRVAICETCPDMGTSGVWANRCKVCGCFMKVKASWAEQKCPLGKW